MYNFIIYYTITVMNLIREWIEELIKYILIYHGKPGIMTNELNRIKFSVSKYEMISKYRYTQIL